MNLVSKYVATVVFLSFLLLLYVFAGFLSIFWKIFHVLNKTP